jgi:hypothetical protein
VGDDAVPETDLQEQREPVGDETMPELLHIGDQTPDGGSLNQPQPLAFREAGWR